jgi:hypothetical protein
MKGLVSLLFSSAVVAVRLERGAPGWVAGWVGLMRNRKIGFIYHVRWCDAQARERLLAAC